MSEFSDQTTSRTTTRGTPHRVPPSFEYNPKIRRWLVYHACVCGFQSVHAGELGRGGGDSRRLRCYRALPPGDRCALVGGVSFCFVVNKKGNMDKESLLSRQNEYGPAQGDVSVSEENARVHAAGHPKFPVAAVLSARPLYNTKSLFFEAQADGSGASMPATLWRRTESLLFEARRADGSVVLCIENLYGSYTVEKNRRAL